MAELNGKEVLGTQWEVSYLVLQPSSPPLTPATAAIVTLNEDQVGEHSVYVAGLPFEVEDAGLINAFRPFPGMVSAIVIKTKNGRGTSRGFGFVSFTSLQQVNTRTNIRVIHENITITAHLHSSNFRLYRHNMQLRLCTTTLLFLERGLAQAFGLRGTKSSPHTHVVNY